MENEKKDKKKGLFKLTKTRIAAIGAAVVIAVSLIPNIGNHEHDVPEQPSTSITEFDPNYNDHEHDHTNTQNPGETTKPGETTTPGETTKPGEEEENTTKPGDGEDEQTVKPEHVHAYTQIKVEYKDNNDGTHTRTLVGTCPKDGASKVLKIGKPVEHNYGEGVVDPVSGDTTYICLDCGSTRVVEKPYEETHTHDYIESERKYEDNGDGTHTLVVIGTCKEDGATKVIFKGQPMKHRENAGVVDPITGETTYTCLDCGVVTRVVEKHIHDYSQQSTKYVNNGDGTHTLVTIGTCPEDGATKVLSKGKVSAHREGPGVVDPKTGDTVYTCLDCGATRTVVKDHGGDEDTHTHHYEVSGTRYEDNGNGTHTLVTIGTCKKDGATKILSRSNPMAHRENAGVVDPTTGETTYSCLDCGAVTRVVKPPVHTHDYSQKETKYVNNGDGTHSQVVIGTCPADGATKELSRGKATAHREDAGVVDPTTGDTVYTCLDCGATRVVKKPDVHTHDYSQKSTKYEDNGDGTHTLVTIGTCPADGATKELSRGSATAHREDAGTLNPATGETTYKCIDCGAVVRVVKPGHVHSYISTTTKLMEKDGGHALATIKTCSCGHTDITYGAVEAHDFKVQHGDEALEHCACGATQTHTHNWVPFGEPFEGQQGYKCECGKTETRSIHTEAEHSYTEIVSSEIKPDGSGHCLVTVKRCSCGKEITEKTNSEGHTFTIVPGSQTEEKCVCGETRAHTHDFQPFGEPFEGKQGYKCDACGATETRSIHTEAEHSYTEIVSSEIKPDGSGHCLVTVKRCSCGKEITEKTNSEGHTFTAVSETEEKCACGETRAHTHNFQPFGEPFEGEQGYRCDACGATKTETIHEHNWVLDETIGDQATYSCSCGATKTETITPTNHEHTFTVVSETEEKCACGETKAHAHNFQPFGEPFEGEQGYRCDACGATDTRTVEIPVTDTTQTTSNGEETGKQPIGDEEIISSDVQEIVESKTEDVEQATDEFSGSEETSKDTEEKNEATDKVEETGIQDTVSETEKESETVKITVEFTPEMTGQDESTFKEFEVPAEVADTAVEEIKSALTDAIEETKEETHIEEAEQEVESQEDEKVFSLDNNKYYY